MTTIQTNNTITLSDGRRLGYAEYGDPNGKAVFLFHGNPGSRLGWMPLEGNRYPSGIRIIAPDRPGFGLSDFKPGRTHLDWPDDVVGLADTLGIERFAVAGVSGGGPHVLVCAWKIPERLTAVGVVSTGPPVPEALEGTSQTNRLIFSLARRAPWLIQLNGKFLAWMVRRNPERMIKQLLSAYPQVDKDILARHEVQHFFKRDMAEAFRQGGRGSAHEVILYARPWPFSLQEIKMQIHLWHGEADNATSPAMGRYLAKTLPHCQANFIPEAGHLWVLDHINEVVSTLTTNLNSRIR
jgi:pimeloyl-ACP methyl ester carboxylesterase